MNKREDKKEHILLAGMEVMKGKGYNGTSVKHIVDAASVPKGSFYNYFTSKEQFALDAIDYAAEQSREYARAALGDANQCPKQRIEAFFAANIDCACEQQFKHGCFLGNMCQEMSESSDAIRSKLDKVLASNTRLIAEVIQQGQNNESICQDIPADTLAEFIFNAWEGALMRAKAAQTRKPLDAFVAVLQHIVA